MNWTLWRMARRNLWRTRTDRRFAAAVRRRNRKAVWFLLAEMTDRGR